MSQQPISPPPIPHSPDPAVGGSVRRSHTISSSSRRTSSRTTDHSEADEWNEHDTVGENWVGVVGTIGEKNSSLHRQASLPSKYNRRMYSGSSIAPYPISPTLFSFEDLAHVFLRGCSGSTSWQSFWRFDSLQNSRWSILTYGCRLRRGRLGVGHSPRARGSQYRGQSESLVIVPTILGRSTSCVSCRSFCGVWEFSACGHGCCAHLSQSESIRELIARYDFAE
jgi:hypothetical protein